MGNEHSGNNVTLRKHVAAVQHRHTVTAQSALSDSSSPTNPYTNGSVDAVDGMSSINDFCEILTEIATEIDTQYTDDRTFNDTTSSVADTITPKIDDDESPSFRDALSFVPKGHFVDSISTVFSFRFDLHGMAQSDCTFTHSLTLTL